MDNNATRISSSGIVPQDKESSAANVAPGIKLRKRIAKKQTIQAREITSFSEQFQLCIQMMAGNILNRRTNGTMLNRINGKITVETYHANLGNIREIRDGIPGEVAELCERHISRIQMGSLDIAAIDDLSVFLSKLTEKSLNGNQVVKLRQKIIKTLIDRGFSMDIYSSASSDLKEAIKRMSMDDRAKLSLVLSIISRVKIQGKDLDGTAVSISESRAKQIEELAMTALSQEQKAVLISEFPVHIPE